MDNGSLIFTLMLLISEEVGGEFVNSLDIDSKFRRLPALIETPGDKSLQVSPWGWCCRDIMQAGAHKVHG